MFEVIVAETILGRSCWGHGRRQTLYGKGFDTETPWVEAGSLDFCRFLTLLVRFLGLPADFFTLPALF